MKKKLFVAAIMAVLLVAVTPAAYAGRYFWESGLDALDDMVIVQSIYDEMEKYYDRALQGDVEEKDFAKIDFLKDEAYIINEKVKRLVKDALATSKKETAKAKAREVEVLRKEAEWLKSRADIIALSLPDLQDQDDNN